MITIINIVTLCYYTKILYTIVFPTLHSILVIHLLLTGNLYLNVPRLFSSGNHLFVLCIHDSASISCLFICFLHSTYK